jgi:pterin-4a-carbinolamine dehydratase
VTKPFHVEPCNGGWVVVNRQGTNICLDEMGRHVRFDDFDQARAACDAFCDIAEEEQARGG